MRLDQYLVEKKHTNTRSQATDLIKRGLVLVDEVTITKPGHQVTDAVSIKIDQELSFVSRAGNKLSQALLDFEISLYDKICIDIGSSTGGFTDCALQNGAKFVYAYDVGTDQMDSTLKTDPKIELHESTNILDVTLPFSDVIFIDVSFTSIKPILKHISGFKGEVIGLIKPQYEAGPINFKQGVLKDLKKHRDILTDVLSYARHLGFTISGLKKSALKGKSGNQEYVLHLKDKANSEDIKTLVGELYA